MYDTEELARAAYQAYGQTTEFRNYQGLPMPDFDDLGEKIRSAWAAAVVAVVTIVAQDDEEPSS